MKARYHSFTNAEIQFDEEANTYSVDESGSVYSFTNPDFSFRQFRSNLVARWEYRPGSTIYLVWENNQTNNESNFISSLSNNFEKLYREQPTNVFMLKISFWFGI
jgi:hypothetical protein